MFFSALSGKNHTGGSLLNVFNGVLDSLLGSVKVAFFAGLGGSRVGKLLAYGLVIA